MRGSVLFGMGGSVGPEYARMDQIINILKTYQDAGSIKDGISDGWLVDIIVPITFRDTQSGLSESTFSAETLDGFEALFQKVNSLL